MQWGFSTDTRYFHGFFSALASAHELIAGAGQGYQYGGSRKDLVAPSAQEKLYDEITGKNQSARNARSPHNRVRADPYDGMRHPKRGRMGGDGAGALRTVRKAAGGVGA